MKMSRITTTLLTIAILAACQQKDPAAPASSGTTSTAPAANGPVLYLEGIYATSTASGSDVRYLLDQNPATQWQTQPGAGPDEGFMLYFANPADLSALEMAPQPGSFLADKGEVTVYVNGNPLPSGQPGARFALNKEPVRSLYVRLETTGKETSTTNTDKDETAITKSSFPANANVGIQDIRIFNAAGQQVQLVAPERVAGTVSASSTLAPQTAYAAANLFDARKEFVWVEGSTSAGEGETITFSFNQPVRITALRLWNGYQRSDEHFKANTRLKSFDFTAAGTTPQTYTLGDYPGGQKIDLSPAVQGSSFSLTVKSVFPGKKYKDLALSDLVFYDGDKPFVLAVQPPAAQPGPSDIWKGLLNRRLANQIAPPAENVVWQSIILRSDGTFVLYKSMSWGADNEDVSVADGNWELVSEQADRLTIKVFGKWFDQSDAPEAYLGNTENTLTRIFSDQLIIDRDYIRGSKYIPLFYR